MNASNPDSSTEKGGTCLVTGGAGFIGCALAPGLVSGFARVVAMDNLHPQIHPSRERPAALHPDVDLRVLDVTEAAHWDALLADVRPDVVIHLAAETGTGQSLTEASRHASVNVLGTTRMLDALAARSMVPRRFLLTSSRAVYGEGAWRRSDGTVFYPGQRDAAMLQAGRWDFEGATALPFAAASTVPAPTSVYGATKLAQEHLLSAWARSFSSELAICRLQNVYGPGQALGNPYTGIVTLFARLARDGKSIPVYEDGAMLRDFVLIDDVAAALHLALASSVAPGRVFDVGTGEAHSIAEVAAIIARRYGAPAPHVTGQFRNGDVRHASCDLGPTRQALGFAPRFPLAEGLERLCAHVDALLSAGEGGARS